MVMLKRVRISNFRNLGNVQFHPAGLNLLIGPNNAGKTSLCSALRFLSLASSMDLESAARESVGEIWNISNAYVKDKSVEFEVGASLQDPDSAETLDYEYLLRISAERETKGQGLSLKVDREQLMVTGAGFARTVLMECDKGKVRLLHERNFFQKNPNQYVDTTAPLTTTMLFRLYDLDTNSRANFFKQYIQSWLYYNLDPKSLRDPKVVSDRPEIRVDGANLAKAMFALHNQNPRTEKMVIDSLRAVEGKIDLFSYKDPDPESIYLFLEDVDRHRFGTQSMSDGTLRFLALAYLVHNLAESTSALGYSPLVIFEEPENGLYVNVLRNLVQKIDVGGGGGQFIFTSHSPYFIDLFEKNLIGVHLMKPGISSSTLTQLDESRVKSLLERMPLGELHFREMLA
jgi:predicted ATPase